MGYSAFGETLYDGIRRQLDAQANNNYRESANARMFKMQRLLMEKERLLMELNRQFYDDEIEY